LKGVWFQAFGCEFKLPSFKPRNDILSLTFGAGRPTVAGTGAGGRCRCRGIG